MSSRDPAGGQLSCIPDSGAPRAARWLFWLVIGSFLALCLAYLLVVPVFEGFDVQAHLAAVNYFRAERRLPELTAESLSHSYELITQPPLYHMMAALAGVGWPVDPGAALARASVSPYFEKGLSQRQSVDLPRATLAALAPAWMARLTSVLGGLVTVLGVWWLARTLFPSRPTFAASAVAIATFVPVFLFLSVTISNDAWSAAACAVVLALAADIYMRARPSSWWLATGAALGVAGLVKYSDLLLGAPLAVAWLLYLRRMGWRAALQGLGFGGLGFALVAGWWFARNLWLYGELVPLNRMAQVILSLNRPQPFTLEETLEYVPWLIASFWGVFVSLIAPPFYLDLTRWFMGIGIASVALAAIRWRSMESRARAFVFLVLLPWLLLVAVGVLHWTRTVSFGEQGRLAYIGAAAFGVLMTVGWQAWLPTRWQPALHLALTAFMLVLAIAMALFLQDRFGQPPSLAQPPLPDRHFDARFDGGMRLVGADFPAGAALAPGQSLPVTLYFTTDEPVAADYTLFLHLADEQNRLLFQHDGVPADGRHPTRQWRPGAIFADRYEIVLPDVPVAGLATLSLGFYPVAAPGARQTVRNGAGEPIGDRVVLASIRLLGTPAGDQRVAPPPIAVWQNGIALVAAEMQYDTIGQPVAVRLTWAPTATVQSDYTVFLQVLDEQDNILAQFDGQPQSGRYPTSTWRAGDVITDTLTWAGDLGNWKRIILGLYDTNGTRLPLESTTATWSDAFELAVNGP